MPTHWSEKNFMFILKKLKNLFKGKPKLFFMPLVARDRISEGHSSTPWQARDLKFETYEDLIEFYQTAKFRVFILLGGGVMTKGNFEKPKNQGHM